MVKYINICRNTDQVRNNGEIKKIIVFLYLFLQGMLVENTD